MHFGAQLLEALLMRNAEMLLLVDDDQSEILEFYVLPKKRMGADDDVDRAFGNPLFYLSELACGDEPRRLRKMHRIAAQPVAEGLEMLACQERGRHHNGDLLAVHRGDEGGAQRDFGLAKADIAANEPIHRAARSKIGQHGGNRRVLILGLLVRKAGGELVINAGADRKLRRLAQLSLGGDLDEFAGDLADAVFHPRLARLPGGAAEPVELGAGLFGAVAREEFDVLDGQEELVAAGIMDFETIVRRAGGFDGAQAGKAADAVIDMDDEIASGEACHLGDEILRPL